MQTPVLKKFKTETVSPPSYASVHPAVFIGHAATLDAEANDARFAKTVERWKKLSEEAKVRMAPMEARANAQNIEEFKTATVRHEKMTRTNRSVIGERQQKVARAAEALGPAGNVQYVGVPVMCTPEMYAEMAANGWRVLYL
ncbi:hypothetical protein L596_018113 [Steinernema carpocapsae]|uniref:Uncharacterized protein n=1 Tax=Steinernema carpocapsae TaxID=34508 RepID=A0A4U5N4F6_STECR|nr:hypothetical protein L596_018113 [Steinernema carpocapsae]